MTCLQPVSSAVTHNRSVQLQAVAVQSANHLPCLHVHVWFDSRTLSSTEKWCLGEQAHNMQQLAGLQQEQQELATRLAALKQQHSDLHAQLQHQARPLLCLLFLYRPLSMLWCSSCTTSIVVQRGGAVFRAAKESCYSARVQLLAH